MKLINKNDIEGVYRQLGLAAEEYVVIHSSFLKTGIIRAEPVTNLPDNFYSVLESVMGENGNIFMPAFDYSFPSTKQVDLRSQAVVVGVWPEWFRVQPGVVRSAHPMFSYCGKGPKAINICQPEIVEYDSFSSSSTMARLMENDAMLLLQGTHLGVATIVVLCEAILKVKYRFLKPFNGELTLTNGKNVKADFFHFCFPFNNEYRENYALLESSLLSSGKMAKAVLGGGSVYAVKFKELYSMVEKLIKNDPFALLSHSPKNYYQFEQGQEVSTPVY